MIKLSNINISFDKPLINNGEIKIANGELEKAAVVNLLFYTLSV